jgi:hypothetical protein
MSLEDLRAKLIEHAALGATIDVAKSSVSSLINNLWPTSKPQFVESRIFLNHRPHTRQWYERAFDASRYPTAEFLYITIMSKNTLPYVKAALRKRARPSEMRVLTWDPTLSEDVFEAMRLHLGENESNVEETYKQIRSAAKEWGKLNSKYKNTGCLKVKTYRSVPTMQGLIVKNHWALIELLPFHGETKKRPAILLEAERAQDQMLLDHFYDAFDELWRSSTNHYA